MKNLLFFSVLMLYQSISFAGDCANCCAGYGGILYGDSSSGRFVCRNGSISQCYSTRHAVMNLQKLRGCCMWNGGVKRISPKGKVVCRNGTISEICSSRPRETMSLY